MTCSHKTRVQHINTLPPLRDIIEAHDLHAQKSLGQNFLLDMNITEKIVREASSCDSDTWENINAIEIGPGPGGLSRAILKSNIGHLTAIEYDVRAIHALQSLHDTVGDLTLLHQDALKTDLTDITHAPRIIIANLPYNIASPLLVNWLQQIRENHHAYQSMTLMFQKEVADRITANVGTRAYGRLSIISQWLCQTHIIYDLPPAAFTPPPKVNSSVVFFKPKTHINQQPKFETIEKITAAAFQQRRKMIRSSLKPYLASIEAVGINPTQRAENLSIDDYTNIAQHYESLGH